MNVIDKLKLSITDACEGTCDFCYRGPIIGKQYLPRESIIAALRSLPTLPRSVHLSGGNPLLHPEFRKIVADLRSLGLPIKLSANPKLFLKRFSDLLPQLHGISLSLNAGDPETHDRIRGIKGDWESLHELANLSSRPKMSLIVVLNPADMSGAIATIEAAKRLRPDALKVQLVERSLQPKGSRDPFHQDAPALLAVQDQLISLFRQLSEVPQLELIPRIGTYSSIEQLVARYLVGEAGPGQGELATCDYMLHNPHIKESGDVFPCCGLSEDRTIGNILEESLGDILERHFRKHDGHTSLTFPSCQHCIFYSHYNPGAPKLVRDPNHLKRAKVVSKQIIPILPVS